MYPPGRRKSIRGALRNSRPYFELRPPNRVSSRAPVARLGSARIGLSLRLAAGLFGGVPLGGTSDLALLFFELRRVRRLRRALAREQLFPLAFPSLIPLAGDLRGELAITKTEGEGHGQRDRPEENRESRRHDVRCDSKFLKCHEHGQEDHTPSPRSRQGAP